MALDKTENLHSITHMFVSLLIYFDLFLSGGDPFKLGRDDRNKIIIVFNWDLGLPWDLLISVGPRHMETLSVCSPTLSLAIRLMATPTKYTSGG